MEVPPLTSSMTLGKSLSHFGFITCAVGSVMPALQSDCKDSIRECGACGAMSGTQQHLLSESSTNNCTTLGVLRAFSTPPSGCGVPMYSMHPNPTRPCLLLMCLNVSAAGPQAMRLSRGQTWSYMNLGLNPNLRTSLVVQWLRICTPNAGGLGSIPGRGTRSRMSQLRA